MSDERPVKSGERRLERIRAERGMPVRRAPIAVGALVGGVLGLWGSAVPSSLLAGLRDALAASGTASATAVDGAGELREVVLRVSALTWPALAGGAIGAIVGALAQTGFRLRPIGGWSMQRPTPAAAGGAAVRLLLGMSILAAGVAAIAANWHGLASLPAQPFAAATASAARIVGDAVAAALCAGVAVAALDVAMARWKWARATDMTEPEAREERRRTDGDPETRARRMRVARRTLAGMARGKDLRGHVA